MARSRAHLLAAAVALASMASAACAGGPAPGDLGIGDHSQALGVNDAGWAVGTTRTAPLQDSCFVREATGAVHTFGSPLTADVVGVYCRAEGVNDHGVAVGSEHRYTADRRAFGRPIRWDRVDGMRDLPTLGGANEGEAAALNDAGVVVGHQRWGEQIVPVRWGSDGSVSWLADRGEGGRASAVNEGGDVVGHVVVGQLLRAARWGAVTGELVVLHETAAYEQSTAADINGDGAVVGKLARVSGIVPVHWAPGATTFSVLPTPSGEGEAMAIDEAGGIVGSARVDGATHAAYWTPGAHRFVDLGRLDGRSATATDVNAAGLVTGWVQTDAPDDVRRAVTFARP